MAHYQNSCGGRELDFYFQNLTVVLYRFRSFKSFERSAGPVKALQNNNNTRWRTSAWKWTNKAAVSRNVSSCCVTNGQSKTASLTRTSRTTVAWWQLPVWAAWGRWAASDPTCPQTAGTPCSAGDMGWMGVGGRRKTAMRTEAWRQKARLGRRTQIQTNDHRPVAAVKFLTFLHKQDF